MQFNTLGSGTLVGLIAMAGVFLVLAIIGATPVRREGGKS